MPAIAAYALWFVGVSVSKCLFRAGVVQPCCHCLCWRGGRRGLLHCNNDVKTYMVVTAGVVPSMFPCWSPVTKRPQDQGEGAPGVLLTRWRGWMSREECLNPKLRHFKLSTRKKLKMFGDNWEEARIIPPILGPNIQGSWIIIPDQWQRLERPHVSWGLKSKTLGLNIGLWSLYTAQSVPTEPTGGGWHLTSAPDQAVCSPGFIHSGEGYFFCNLPIP